MHLLALFFLSSASSASLPIALPALISADIYAGSLKTVEFFPLAVSISQVIGCEDRLRSDLYCVEWGVKLCSNSNSNFFPLALLIPCQLKCNSQSLLVKMNLAAAGDDNGPVYIARRRDALLYRSQAPTFVCPS